MQLCVKSYPNLQMIKLYFRDLYPFIKSEQVLEFKMNINGTYTVCLESCTSAGNWYQKWLLRPNSAMSKSLWSCYLWPFVPVLKSWHCLCEQYSHRKKKKRKRRTECYHSLHTCCKHLFCHFWFPYTLSVFYYIFSTHFYWVFKIISAFT